jgi:hypothetical protein
MERKRDWPTNTEQGGTCGEWGENKSAQNFGSKTVDEDANLRNVKRTKTHKNLRGKTQRSELDPTGSGSSPAAGFWRKKKHAVPLGSVPELSLSTEMLSPS